MVKQVFGNQLRAIRRDQQMTQHEVALSCDMSLRFYQDMEAGNKQPTLTTLFRLCDALNSTPEALTESAWKAWRSKGRIGK